MDDDFNSNIDSIRLENIEKEASENLFDESSSAWVIFPIKYPDVWESFKDLENSFFTAEDFNFSNQDKNHSEFKMSQPILQCLQNILAWIVYWTGQLNHCNYTGKLIQHVKIPESRAFFGLSCANDVIHCEVYSSLLYFFLQVDTRYNEKISFGDFIRLNLLNLPSVVKKKNWIDQNLLCDTSLSERLIINCIVKCLLFSCNEIMKIWLSEKNLCKIFVECEDKIKKDHLLFYNHCLILYKKLTETKLSRNHLISLISSAVQIETDFSITLLSPIHLEYTASDIENYIKAKANIFLKRLNEENLYIDNPQSCSALHQNINIWVHQYYNMNNEIQYNTSERIHNISHNVDIEINPDSDF